LLPDLVHYLIGSFGQQQATPISCEDWCATSRENFFLDRSESNAPSDWFWAIRSNMWPKWYDLYSHGFSSRRTGCCPPSRDFSQMSLSSCISKRLNAVCNKVYQLLLSFHSYYEMCTEILVITIIVVYLSGAQYAK